MRIEPELLQTQGGRGKLSSPIVCLLKSSDLNSHVQIRF
uniref:Uncharacterized protein n=1 Tax=Anguilla anguilla TaxID=7936 RepID=A0A0E9UER9_ANGAN